MYIPKNIRHSIDCRIHNVARYLDRSDVLSTCLREVRTTISEKFLRIWSRESSTQELGQSSQKWWGTVYLEHTNLDVRSWSRESNTQNLGRSFKKLWEIVYLEPPNLDVCIWEFMSWVGLKIIYCKPWPSGISWPGHQTWVNPSDVRGVGCHCKLCWKCCAELQVIRGEHISGTSKPRCVWLGYCKFACTPSKAQAFW